MDAECRTALVGLGHDAWTVAQAGRHEALDVDQVIYAADSDAVFVTHDRELATSRSAMPMARIIRVQCREWDAPALLSDAVDGAMIALLERNPYVIITISRRSNGLPNVKFRFGTEADG